MAKKYVSPETRAKIAAAIKARHDEKRRSREETAAPEANVAPPVKSRAPKKAAVPRGTSKEIAPAQMIAPAAEIAPAQTIEAAVTTINGASSKELAGDYPRASLSCLVSFRYQPRQKFDEEGLEGLASSIRQIGVFTPIIFRSDPDWYIRRGVDGGKAGFYVLNSRVEEGKPGTGSRYLCPPPFVETQEEADALLAGSGEVVAGERRVRGSIIADKDSIPALSLDLSDKEALMIAVAENEERKDVSPIESARSYKQLQDLGATQEEIAGKVKRSRSQVANRMRLLELPEDVIEMIDLGELSEAHGKVLCGMSAFPVFVSYYAQAIVKRGTSSKAIEKGIALDWDELRQAAHKKLLAYGYNFEYDFVTASKKYPGTFWKAVVNDGYKICLDVALDERLEKEAKERKQAKTETKKAQMQTNAKGTDAELPKVSDLDYNAFVRLDDNKCPPGCTKACECRGRANSYGSIINICTNPKAYNKLKNAATREANKGKREKIVRWTADIRQNVVTDAITEDDRAVAVVAYEVLRQLPEKVLLDEVARLGITDDFDVKRFNSYETKTPAMLDMVAQLGTTKILALTSSAMMIKDLKGYVDGYCTGFAEWYCDPKAIKAPSKLDEPEGFPTDL